MPPNGEVTLGELSRGLEKLETHMNGGFAAVNRRLDSLQFVPRGEFKIQIDALGEDIKELKDSKQWMQRALVGSLLFPVLVAIVVALVVTR